MARQGDWFAVERSWYDSEDIKHVGYENLSIILWCWGNAKYHYGGLICEETLTPLDELDCYSKLRHGGVTKNQISRTFNKMFQRDLLQKFSLSSKLFLYIPRYLLFQPKPKHKLSGRKIRVLQNIQPHFSEFCAKNFYKYDVDSGVIDVLGEPPRPKSGDNGTPIEGQNGDQRNPCINVTMYECNNDNNIVEGSPPTEPKPDYETEIKLLRERYSETELKIIDDAIEAFKSTRKTFSIGTIAKYKQYKNWDTLPPDQVIAGLERYLDRGCATEGKPEAYAWAIIKNQGNGVGRKPKSADGVELI